MPITQKNKHTKLEQRINLAIKLVSVQNLLDFSNQLTPDQDRFIPTGSTITFLEVVQACTRTLIKKDIKVKVYKSWNPWSKARAYTDGRNININKRHHHTLKTLIKTISHELSHVSDHYSNESFSHGSNANQHTKKDTAPIMLADLFLEFLEKKELL